MKSLIDINLKKKKINLFWSLLVINFMILKIYMTENIYVKIEPYEYK